jgi:hypothetical protein
LSGASLTSRLLLFIINVSILFSSPKAIAELRANKAEAVICEGRYALCTSAPCIPNPSDPNSTAICACEVTEGKSYGFKSCQERVPRTDENEVTSLVSTYSFAQAPTKPIIVCPSGKPWTDCLDKPCTIDPLNPLSAICSCDIKRTSRFVTYGANCNSLTCNTGFWSGATIEDFVNATEILGKALGLDKSPAIFCPGVNISK